MFTIREGSHRPAVSVVLQHFALLIRPSGLFMRSDDRATTTYIHSWRGSLVSCIVEVMEDLLSAAGGMPAMLGGYISYQGSS